MCEVIRAQIEHNGPHTGPCLQCLRSAAVECGLWGLFNPFIRSLSRDVCVRYGVGLITERECAGCEVSESEGKVFLEGGGGVKEEEDDSDADLLDEL